MGHPHLALTQAGRKKQETRRRPRMTVYRARGDGHACTRSREGIARARRSGLGVEFRAGRPFPVLGECSDRFHQRRSRRLSRHSPDPLESSYRRVILMTWEIRAGRSQHLSATTRRFLAASLVPRVRAILACDTMMRARRQGPAFPDVAQRRNQPPSPPHRPHRARASPLFRAFAEQSRLARAKRANLDDESAEPRNFRGCSKPKRLLTAPCSVSFAGKRITR